MSVLDEEEKTGLKATVSDLRRVKIPESAPVFRSVVIHELDFLKLACAAISQNPGTGAPISKDASAIKNELDSGKDEKTVEQRKKEEKEGGRITRGIEDIYSDDEHNKNEGDSNEDSVYSIKFKQGERKENVMSNSNPNEQLAESKLIQPAKPKTQVKSFRSKIASILNDTSLSPDVVSEKILQILMKYRREKILRKEREIMEKPARFLTGGKHAGGSSGCDCGDNSGEGAKRRKHIHSNNSSSPYSKRVRTKKSTSSSRQKMNETEKRKDEKKGEGEEEEDGMEGKEKEEEEEEDGEEEEEGSGNEADDDDDDDDDDNDDNGKEEEDEKARQSLEEEEHEDEDDEEEEEDELEHDREEEDADENSEPGEDGENGENDNGSEEEKESLEEDEEEEEEQENEDGRNKKSKFSSPKQTRKAREQGTNELTDETGKEGRTKDSERQDILFAGLRSTLSPVFKAALDSIFSVFDGRRNPLPVRSQHRLHTLANKLDKAIPNSKKYRLASGSVKCKKSGKKMPVPKILVSLALSTQPLFKYILLTSNRKFSAVEKTFLKDFFTANRLKIRDVPSAKIRAILT